MIKLIASDLDGTLLTSFKQLTPRLIEALKRAAEKNVIFVPATGRTLCAVPQYVKEISSAEYIITSNGACVYKNGSKTPVFKECLEPEHAETVFNAALELNCVTEIFADGMAYIGKNHADSLNSFGIKGRQAEYIRTTRTVVDDLRSLMRCNIESIENINVIFNDMSLRERFRNDIKSRISASVTSSSPSNIEISSLAAAKGRALKNLCSVLGISPEEVLAFGDSENDIDMLDFAGTGVLMENSALEIRKPEFLITSSCDNYGVARIIEDLIK